MSQLPIIQEQQMLEEMGSVYIKNDVDMAEPQKEEAKMP